MMQQGDKVAIVCCSNGEPKSYQEKLEHLHDILTKIDLVPVWSDYIYEQDSVFSGTARQRAESLMNFYQDDEIKAIFDISGGDIANEILPYLDFEVIAKSDKQFWGYSDLTTIINAIYAKTGKTSVLYQIRNMLYDHADRQIEDFSNTVMYQQMDLLDFEYHFLQGQQMQGVVIGGNIRCLLKLAGTPYMPDFTNKILLLEAYGGGVAQMVTYLSQLQQLGAFEKAAGILLGTFTKMMQEQQEPTIYDLIKQYAGDDMPIVYTTQIGHGTDSRAIVVGEEVNLTKI
ncbi:MAG: LD-carboxypeptidase [Lachnospiraceae bacterium]|nr:LD-carboxypeptidase [Lachnospiraceae bacterium]